MAQCECSVCNLIFTGLTAFDKHLGRLTETGFEHLKPSECGLVVRKKDGKVSLPPPETEPFWRKLWLGLTGHSRSAGFLVVKIGRADVPARSARNSGQHGLRS